MAQLFIFHHSHKSIIHRNAAVKVSLVSQQNAAVCGVGENHMGKMGEKRTDIFLVFHPIANESSGHNVLMYALHSS